jgi:serine/threonine-protein kinase
MGVEASGGGEGSPELSGMPAVGDIIDGKFTIEGVLGVGGMGAVFAARHIQLGQRVAIKVLLREAAKRPEAVARFLREARSAVGLQSAHVVRVMDVGTLEDGLPYMVMEHLTGTDLHALLEQRQTLPVEEAVDYVLQAMEAVAEAHAAGLVHRDLKPANLFLTRSPDGAALVKVLDFGISKAVESTGSEQSLTATAAVMGSPLYMSPEQLRSSKNVDARTDVWALGTILFELVTGRTPFEAESVMALCTSIAVDAPARLRKYRQDAPRDFEAIVMACIEKEPARRPQNAGELATALRAFASSDGKLAVDRIARIGPPPLSSAVSSKGGASGSISGGGVASTTGFAETVASWQTSGGTKKRRQTTTVAIAIGIGGALAVAAALLLRPSSPPAAQLLPASPAAPSTVPAATAPVSASAAPIAPSAAAASVAPVDPPGPGSMPGASSSPARPAWPRGAPPPRPSTKPGTSAPPAATTKPAEDLLLDRK